MPNITPLDPPPVFSDGDTFRSKIGPFLLSLSTMVTEINAQLLQLGPGEFPDGIDINGILLKGQVATLADNGVTTFTPGRAACGIVVSTLQSQVDGSFLAGFSGICRVTADDPFNVDLISGGGSFGVTSDPVFGGSGGTALEGKIGLGASNTSGSLNVQNRTTISRIVHIAEF